MKNGKSPKAQPFSEHFKELRLRLIYIIAALFVGCSVGFTMHQALFHFIRRPLHEQLYYTTPTGGFNAIIKVSILFGVIVTTPVLIYQIGRFVAPAFQRRIGAMPIILLSVILALLGVSFAYYVSLPAALHFLANIDSGDLHSLITVNEYLNFVSGYMASFALLFQLPLIMLFINRIKPQRPAGLMRVQRWVILFSFVLAAVLTPTPDPINQTIMALPIILLYQFSVGLIWYANRRERRKKRHQVVEAAPVAIEAAPEEVVTPIVPGMIIKPFVEPAPVVVVSEPDPAAYGAAAYNDPSSLPAASTEPIAPVEPTPPAKTNSAQPKLIMDIFWVPHTPTS